ncbi:hypothetical protein GQ600_25179 [Phytophthora cactorum]|nr:hypothetical protein GQ600_25179 [Phytophthora cactorum]
MLQLWGKFQCVGRFTHSRQCSIGPSSRDNACNAQFSSQAHPAQCITQVSSDLLTVWQGWLEESEIKQQIKTEALAETGKPRLQASYVSAISTMRTSAAIPILWRCTPCTEILEQANSVRMTVCKNDDDPFWNDEVIPKDGAFATISVRLKNGSNITSLYGLSTGSFTESASMEPHKKLFQAFSNNTNASLCRYRFPRGRVDTMSSGRQRTLGHEIMNGFNYELMATFKCNNDIQILLGGSDVANCMQYCCKYVTKQQKCVIRDGCGSGGGIRNT